LSVLVCRWPWLPMMFLSLSLSDASLPSEEAQVK
jgi:hypothetical protein